MSQHGQRTSAQKVAMAEMDDRHLTSAASACFVACAMFMSGVRGRMLLSVGWGVGTERNQNCLTTFHLAARETLFDFMFSTWCMFSCGMLFST